MAEPNNTTNQTHSGSGDNVAGDKIIINLPQPETTERTGRVNNLAGLGILDPSRFVGRGDELRILAEKLGAAPVVAITGLVGMGGVGTSELAV
ncbi:MAG: hypothetical protein AAF685_07405, partial [Cyanobacteria bacterium P01_C01_bin.89]